MKVSRWVGVTAGVVLTGAGLATAIVMNMDQPTPVVSAAAPAGETVAGDDVVQRALRAGKPTVAQFGANACAQCRDMKPVLEALRREHGERITVVDVNLIAHKEANYIQRFRIQLMPTQIFFDAQGQEIGRNLGKLSGDEILSRLQVTGASPMRTPAAPPAPAGASL